MSGKKTVSCWLLLWAVLICLSGCSLFRGQSTSAEQPKRPVQFVDLGPRVNEPRAATRIPFQNPDSQSLMMLAKAQGTAKKTNQKFSRVDDPVQITVAQEPNRSQSPPKNLSDFPERSRSAPVQQVVRNTQVAQPNYNRGGSVLSLDLSGDEPRTDQRQTEPPPPPALPGFSPETQPRETEVPLPPPAPPYVRKEPPDLRITKGPRRKKTKLPPSAGLSLKPVTQTSPEGPPSAPSPDLPPPVSPKTQLDKQGKPGRVRAPVTIPRNDPPPPAVPERKPAQQESAPDNQPLGAPDLQAATKTDPLLPPPVSPHKQLRPIAQRERPKDTSEPEEYPLARRNVVALSPKRYAKRPKTTKPKRLVPRPLPVNGLKPVNHVPPGKPAGNLKTLHQLAAEGYSSIDGYIVKFRRREVVGGRKQPEELMLFKFRKKPWSTYFKWLGGAGKGRECVYVKNKHGNKIYTKTAAGDIPFVPAGQVIALSPDSPLVRSKSRHAITEAGIGVLIDKFGTLVGLMEQRDLRRGSLRYLGLVRRPEFKKPVEAVLQIIPPKAEKALPKGGRRFWYFDTRLRFPVLIITQDANQREVEYYCYGPFRFGFFSDEEFDPKALWGE